jgi:hypothetical protein
MKTKPKLTLRWKRQAIVRPSSVSPPSAAPVFHATTPVSTVIATRQPGIVSGTGLTVSWGALFDRPTVDDIDEFGPFALNLAGTSADPGVGDDQRGGGVAAPCRDGSA